MPNNKLSDVLITLINNDISAFCLDVDKKKSELMILANYKSNNKLIKEMTYEEADDLAESIYRGLSSDQSVKLNHQYLPQGVVKCKVNDKNITLRYHYISLYEGYRLSLKILKENIN